jgi:hypothetical protein
MRQRTLLTALAVAVLVAAAGIAVVLRPDEAGAQRQQQGFVVSFAAAESALGDEEAERREQIRDNRSGDLASQPTGPGRALYHDTTLSTKDDQVAAGALDQDMTATVREVTADRQQAVPADVRVHRDAERVRVDAPLRTGLPTSLNVVITLNSGVPATPDGPAARIVLICPENDGALGCGD